MTTRAARPSSSADDPPSASAIGTPATDQILRQALQAFACDGASLLGYSREGRVELLVSSDAGTRRADQLQLGLDEGAAVSAREQDEVALSGNVRGDRRWPRWGSAVAGMGWQSVLSAPLATSGRDLGVLNLYAYRTAAFDATHAYAARIFAQHAATVLAHAEEADELQEAVISRHRIGLAQTLLMEQRGLDAHDAFELLRRTSERHGVKLRLVAEHVVATGRLIERLTPSETGGRPGPG